MQFVMKQISNMEKVRATDNIPAKELYRKKALKGERVSYQIVMRGESLAYARLTVDAPFDQYTEIFQEREVYMDVPVKSAVPLESSDEFITLEPGFMPDELVPIAEQNNLVRLRETNTVLWVNINVPEDMEPGQYTVKIRAEVKTTFPSADEPLLLSSLPLPLEVCDAVLPKQNVMYTRWFYADCIATQHNVEIFSEQHWALIEKYIAAAAKVGVNMILTPIHTPPLDTEIGTTRPCVQLVDIEKNGDTYTFDFTKFKRFVAIAKKSGIEYFEMAHLFSQWGAKCAPNIMVTENGKTDYKFGWHVAADDPEYIAFLKQYLKAVTDELKAEGIDGNTYFHVSDEPNTRNMEGYARAVGILKPLLGNSKIFDALSHVEFYEKGLVTCPVTSVGTIHDFLPHKIENQWAYYCCGPITKFTNSFLTIPSARVRILGLQLFKYDVKGFLHWGLNFYNTAHSIYPINPYQTTSSDGAFSSGDAYILYPSKDGAHTSLRGEITYQAMQDIRICNALAQKIGKDKVIELIDELAGCDLRFDQYPICNELYEKLHDKACELLTK